MDELYEDLGESRANLLAQSFINAIGDNDPSSALETFAKRTGYTPEAVSETVQGIYSHFTEQAEQYITKQTGIPGREILEWGTGEFDRSSWQEISRLHWFGKGKAKFAGYDALIREYKKAHRS